MEPDPKRIETLMAVLPLGELDTGPGLETALDQQIEALGRATTPAVVISFIARDEGLRTDYEGLDGYRAGCIDWFGSFDYCRNELDDWREGSEATVVLTRQMLTPRGGDTPIEETAAVAVWWEGDLIARLEFHLDRETALRAAEFAADTR